ncbi:MAG: VCBS repeat-containing protein [Saprospiraceae bacterium]|nr:VCBS repeat-containing protein [Saprospiraceae bacterium]
MNKLNTHWLLLFACYLVGTDTLLAQINFSEVTLEAGIDHYYKGVNEMGAGAAFFDMDNDGDEDLWVSGGMLRDVLYENDGTGQFTEIGYFAGLGRTFSIVTTGVITGDLNNDGFKDVVLLTQKGFPNFILKNNGNKTFREVYDTGLENSEAYNLAAAMADVNQDGFLDIYTGHYIDKHGLTYSSSNPDSIVGFEHDCYANHLYLNNGDWTFTDVSDEWLAADDGCALAIAFSDYDNDFDPDLLIINDFGQWVTPNALLSNDQDRFVDVSVSSHMDVGLYGMGVAIGDYDNDLDLDYYITNLGDNALLTNNGDGTYSDEAQRMGVADGNITDSLLATGWGTAFIDMDNDADLDLYVVNGYVPAASFIANPRENPNRCFENDGTGNFDLVEGNTSLASVRWGRGFTYADIDNDGDLDFFVGNVNRQATSDTIQKVQLFRNDNQNLNKWLKIKLEGVVNNRDGFGSQVRIKANGRWYLQESNGGYGTHASQHSTIIHFGLGAATMVDSVIVYWPGGAEQVLTQVAANQLINIVEGVTVSLVEQLNDNTSVQVHCYPNPFRGQTTLEYTLAERSPVSVRIFDSIGREVFAAHWLNQQKGYHQVQWGSVAKGLYVVSIQTNKQTVQQTIISN